LVIVGIDDRLVIGDWGIGGLDPETEPEKERAMPTVQIRYCRV
jgi:hypothetical protein